MFLMSLRRGGRLCPPCMTAEPCCRAGPACPAGKHAYRAAGHMGPALQGGRDKPPVGDGVPTSRQRGSAALRGGRTGKPLRGTGSTAKPAEREAGQCGLASEYANTDCARCAATNTSRPYRAEEIQKRSFWRRFWVLLSLMTKVPRRRQKTDKKRS